MAFKSLCCIWCLLLLFQHSFCFSLQRLCAQRCLLGRGGIACNCNAIHFAGKRSFAPQHRNVNADLISSHRRNFLLSILNRPEFVDRDRDIILPVSLDQDDTGKLDGQPLAQADATATGRSDTKGTLVDNGDAPVFPEHPQFRFRNGKTFDQPSFHKGYGELTQKLAQLVRDIWRDMAAHSTNPEADNHSNQLPGIQVDSGINRYGSREDSSSDLANSDESAEGDDAETSNETKLKLQVTSHLVQALKSLTDHLPVLVRQYEAKRGDSGAQHVGADAATIERPLRPHFEDSGVGSENLKAWNRLTQYLTYAMARKQQLSSLHRTKRDGSMQQSEMATENEKGDDKNL